MAGKAIVSYQTDARFLGGHILEGVGRQLAGREKTMCFQSVPAFRLSTMFATMLTAALAQATPGGALKVPRVLGVWLQLFEGGWTGD